MPGNINPPKTARATQHGVGVTRVCSTSCPALKYDGMSYHYFCLTSSTANILLKMATEHLTLLEHPTKRTCLRDVRIHDGAPADLDLHRRVQHRLRQHLHLPDARRSSIMYRF